MATIGSALNPDAGILLYGCNVAKGAEGEAFVSALAQSVRTKIAASTNLTGAAAKGGDWTLEYTTEQIGKVGRVFPAQDLSAYNGILVGAYGTADGTYDFSATPGSPGSAGAGYKTFSDKFVVNNEMADSGMKCNFE